MLNHFLRILTIIYGFFLLIYSFISLWYWLSFSFTHSSLIFRLILLFIFIINSSLIPPGSKLSLIKNLVYMTFPKKRVLLRHFILYKVFLIDKSVNHTGVSQKFDFKEYVTVCASWKIQPKFFKFVIFNPCQSSPSLTILVSLFFLSCFLLS